MIEMLRRPNCPYKVYHKIPFSEGPILHDFCILFATPPGQGIALAMLMPLHPYFEHLRHAHHLPNGAKRLPPME